MKLLPNVLRFCYAANVVTASEAREPGTLTTSGNKEQEDSFGVLLPLQLLSQLHEFGRPLAGELGDRPLPSGRRPSMSGLRGIEASLSNGLRRTPQQFRRLGRRQAE